MLFENVLANINVVNFSFVPTLGLACSVPDFDYTAEMVLVTMGPICIAICIGIAFTLVKLAAAKPFEKGHLESYIVPDKFAEIFTKKELLDLKVIFGMIDVTARGSINKLELKIAAENYDPENIGEIMLLFEDKSSKPIQFQQFLEITHNARLTGSAKGLASLSDKIEAVVSARPEQKIIGAFLTLTFLVMIKSSTNLLHFFKCDELVIPEADGGGEKRYMFKDYSIDCDSDKYFGWSIYAGLMCFIYPIGALYL